MAATDTRLALVLAYARRGWRVLPLHYPVEDAHGHLYCSCEHADCGSVGKHPLGRLVPHGVSDATTDEATIRGWYGAEPACSWGVATGSESGVIVLDVDPRHGGDESLRDLVARWGDLPVTLVVQTGGGGEHYWFAHPGGTVGNSIGAVGPGLDLRGDGGYVVVPPSVHALRRTYRWDASLDVETASLATLPPWLLARSEPQSYQVWSAAVAPDAIPEGQRDNTLTSLAGSMRYRGLSAEEMLPSLLAVNATRCRPPLPESDVRRIAWSIGQKPAGEVLDGMPLETATPAKPPAEVLPFPVGALPEVVRRFAAYWARVLHSVPEIVAIPCLTYASGAIGRTRSIHLSSQYTETALLWSAIIGPPGSAKSAAMRVAGKALSVREAQYQAEYREARENYLWQMSQRKKGQPAPDQPAAKRRLSQNATMEALVKLLSEDDHGIVMNNDELAAWIGSFDQYRPKGNGSDRQHWLSIWSGEEVIVDRIKDGGSFFVSNPFVSVCGTIQPDLLRTLTSELGNDGFLSRFFFAYIPRLPLVGLDEPGADDGENRAWDATINDLLSQELPMLVGFTPAGSRAFRAGSAAWAVEANSPETDARLLDFYHKGNRLCGRLALVLHCIREASGEVGEPVVDEATAENAWALMRYFASTLKYVVMRIGETQTDQLVETIEGYARSHDGTLTLRDAQRIRLGGIRGAKEMEEAFRQVQNHGLGAVETVQVSGGRRITLRLNASGEYR